MGDRQDGVYDTETAELIRHKVRKLHPAYRLDGDDVGQDLWAYVTAGMKSHDPNRSCERTFKQRIVTSKLATVIQHATAHKRDRCRERRLEVVPEHLLIDQSDSPAHLDTSMDVNQAVSALPSELRELAILFMEFSEAEVIRKTAYSREQVRRMRREIEKQFRAMGLAPDSQK